MALFNEIQAGRFSALLQKLCSIKGAAPAPQLAGEIIPTLPLEVDRPEWKYLAGERLCWGTATQAAVAGENAHVGLFNLPQSGLLAVTELINIRPAAAASVYMGHLDTLFSGGGTAQAAHGFRDSRLPRGPQTSTAVLYTKSNAGSLLTTNLFRVYQLSTNQAGIQLGFPIVLGPGSGFVVVCATVNTELRVSMAWRERKIEQDELL